jgi:hypothetical protein
MIEMPSDVRSSTRTLLLDAVPGDSTANRHARLMVSLWIIPCLALMTGLALPSRSLSHPLLQPAQRCLLCGSTLFPVTGNVREAWPERLNETSPRMP